MSGHIALSLATLGMPPGRSPSRHSGLWRSCPTGSGLGIGSALVRAGLDACRRLGHEVVVLLGHPAFYLRFGFMPARPLGVTCEYPPPDEVFVVADLSPGALRGRHGLVRYALDFALGLG